jgi:hypothetical protein
MCIALFTPFSPDIGGGSVQLRSHLAQLPELNVEWNYLANTPVDGERRRWLGRPLTPGQFAWDLSARSGFLPGSTKAAKEIAAKLDADRYWIVAHYEGISVAAELLDRGKHVHLTVHDEPLAMVIRSRRFRALWPLLSRTFAQVLKGARSVDVTSTAMRDYFKKKYYVDSFSLYKYLPALPVVQSRISEKHLTVGHIGSLYHPAPFRQFLLACRDLAAALHRELRIVRIGGSPEMDEVISEKLASFEIHGELLEHDALPVLATCDFVYAMYPPGFRFRGFRRTSLPIKLSTYIQAQRPIFAHTPPDSGLAKLVERHRLGQVCTSSHTSDIRQSIHQLLALPVAHEHFEAVRQELMGKEQIDKLRQALLV